MQGLIHSVVKEPLTHFLILGGLFFILYQSFDAGEAAPVEHPIQLTQADISKALQKRAVPADDSAPEPASVESLVRDTINRELLFNEAMALNMHQSGWVKDRLVDQMTRYLEGQYLAGERPPTEVLQAYHAAHPDRYQTADRLSFIQIQFNPDFLHEVERLLKAVEKQTDFRQQMTPFKLPSLISAEFRGAHQSGVQDLFGDLFVRKLKSAALHQWFGPVHSSRGMHLVYIESVEISHPETFETIQERVYQDWITAQRTDWVEGEINSLWHKHGVRLEDYLPE